MKTKSGFTIVELLIVIVIIGILAAISLIAYTGVQTKARISTAQSELSSLSRASGLFQVDHGGYPNTPAEWSTTFKNANMFTNTRIQTAKSFIICSTTAGDKYSLIAVSPVSITDTAGQKMYYIDQTGARTFTWDTSVTGTFSAERACKQTINGFEFATWAHDLT